MTTTEALLLSTEEVAIFAKMVETTAVTPWRPNLAAFLGSPQPPTVEDAMDALDQFGADVVIDCDNHAIWESEPMDRHQWQIILVTYMEWVDEGIVCLDCDEVRDIVCGLAQRLHDVSERLTCDCP